MIGRGIRRGLTGESKLAKPRCRVTVAAAFSAGVAARKWRTPEL